MHAYIQVVSQKYLEWGNTHITVLALPLLQVSFVPFKVSLPLPTASLELLFMMLSRTI